MNGTDKLTKSSSSIAKTEILSPSTDLDLSHGHVHEQGAAHAHVHSEESLRAVINRLSRIEGHIRGIKTMVQENRDCPEVLTQIAAVRGALDRVARMILDEHLTECIARAAQVGNLEDEIDELKKALDRFLH
ncbi:metal-sensing transcriptional repressor [Scytonema millei]|uniref:Metal-sensitive transcriptional regulator n=1 Tax=Scytonema millei VB511283 TaxID=1245923 RepID=A0A9X5E146_9CYAN|nr:metal-sensitive transcriptional regulator [Scytonema millei]NHC33516.1 metal-sensitive transcriptional regulator [Scytonema millei VB511283]